jgi:hypothetical protein
MSAPGIGRELEHEIGKEPVEVVFHRFVQIAGGDAVKGCEVIAGVNRRLEFELGAGFEGACGFALVLALSQMREHGRGSFGRADLPPLSGRFTWTNLRLTPFFLTQQPMG